MNGQRFFSINFHWWWAPLLGLALVSSACEKPEPSRPRTLTIAYSNDVNGVIRACGCATNDFGGMGRRTTFARIVEDSTENFLLVDAGDFFGSDLAFGPQKAEVTMRSMVLMDYDAVLIGERELGLGVDFILEMSAELGLPVIAANLRYAQTGELLFPPSKIVRLPTGLNVGLIGVWGQQIAFPPQVREGTLSITDPFKAVGAQLTALSDSTDMIVVLAHMDRRQTQALADRFPEVGLFVHGHEGRPLRKLKKRGKAHILQVAKEGRTMGTAFVVLDENGGIQSLISESTQISNRFEDDEAIVELFRSFGMKMTAPETAKSGSGG